MYALVIPTRSCINFFTCTERGAINDVLNINTGDFKSVSGMRCFPSARIALIGAEVIKSIMDAQGS